MHSRACRLTDAAYRVFFDSIEAQGRALLRMTLVGRRATCLFAPG
jgi:hypothetical protein